MSRVEENCRCSCRRDAVDDVNQPSLLAAFVDGKAEAWPVFTSASPQPRTRHIETYQQQLYSQTLLYIDLSDSEFRFIVYQTSIASIMSSTNKTIIAFDLYGTILSTESIAKELATHFGDEKASSIAALWRRYQLEYTWRLNSMGPFPSPIPPNQPTN